MRWRSYRNSRILYVPGLLSLLFLPFLGIWYLHQKKPLPNIRSIELINFPVGDGITVAEPQWQLIPKRNYSRFLITGNKANDSVSLHLAHEEIKKLFQTHDTITGVWIQFTERAQYWALIRTLEIIGTDDRVDSESVEQGIFVYLADSTLSLVRCSPPIVNIRNLKQLEGAQEKDDQPVYTAFLYSRLHLTIPALLLFLLLTTLSLSRLTQQRQP